MPDQPNILFLMTDQMQAQVLERAHICRTPNFDRLAARGVRFTRAYTPNAICSPARASLMTGRLPHSHGVLTVTHTVDPDQSTLRTELPHWAQHLRDAGYATGYFGKWHVERTEDLAPFGWTDHNLSTRGARQELGDPSPKPEFSLKFDLENPGYNPAPFYGAHNVPPEDRGMGGVTQRAADWLETAVKSNRPWCCFASIQEPHDPFFCHEDALAAYEIDSLELPPNADDDCADKPGLYRKHQRIFAAMTERQRKEAAACYYASVTELDAQFGKLLDLVDNAGQWDNTIIVLTTDHGEHLGAHGLFCKNIGAFEEVYNIPLIMAGPGIAEDRECAARVGLHDLGPTLLELAGGKPLETAGESRSFAQALAKPDDPSVTGDFRTGFAEYFGGRLILTQRVYYRDDWKLVLNGFDDSELYHLGDDPCELRNRIADPAVAEELKSLYAEIWTIIGCTNDHSLYRTQYPILRGEPWGPGIAEIS